MLLQHLLLAGLLAAPPLSARAQTPPSSPTAANPSLAFEVTSVKPSKAGTSSSRSSMDNGRFTASNILLRNLMQYSAFDIPEPRILGGPKWLNTERFDIEAKLDPATYQQLEHLDRHQRRLQTRAIFQQLLADRFHLRYHWETRTLPIYALVVAKSGPHLQPSTRTDDNASTDINNSQMTATNVTLAGLAQTLTQELSRELGRVVTDQTNIPGRFDLTLKWTPETGEDPHATASDGATASPDAGPSIFTALQEQLGLKLEASKGPVQVLLIDGIDLPSPD